MESLIFKSLAVAIAICMWGVVVPASAGVITFEEPGFPPEALGRTTFTVGELKFSNAQVVDFRYSPYLDRLLPTPVHGLSLPSHFFGFTQVERTDGGLFDLLELSFAAVAADPFGAALLVNGYRDGVLLYQIQTPRSSLANDNTDTYAIYAFVVSGVDRVDLATTYYQNGFTVVDNFTYALVPEPGSLALAGLALAIFGAARRKVSIGRS
jgi:PEP-CTERM motif